MTMYACTVLFFTPEHGGRIHAPKRGYGPIIRHVGNLPLSEEADVDWSVLFDFPTTVTLGIAAKALVRPLSNQGRRLVLRAGDVFELYEVPAWVGVMCMIEGESP